MTAQWHWGLTPEQIAAVKRNGMEWEMRPENWEHRRTWVSGSTAGTFPIGDSHLDLIDAGIAVEREHGGRMPQWAREFTTFDINASMDLSNEARMTRYPPQPDYATDEENRPTYAQWRRHCRAQWRKERMIDDTDIQASIAANARGEHPADHLRVPLKRIATQLTGEAYEAHEALRQAGIDLKAAQEQLAQKQLGLRAALDRWLTVNAGEK